MEKAPSSKTPIRIYRLTNLIAGSDRFGDCEICNSPVNTSYMIVITGVYTLSNGKMSLPEIGRYFGHKSCMTRLATQH